MCIPLPSPGPVYNQTQPEPEPQTDPKGSLYIVTQIWDGDAILGEPISVHHTKEEANAACRAFVETWAPDPPENQNENDELAHWQWDGDFQLISAAVTRLQLQAAAKGEQASECPECQGGTEGHADWCPHAGTDANQRQERIDAKGEQA